MVRIYLHLEYLFKTFQHLAWSDKLYFERLCDARSAVYKTFV